MVGPVTVMLFARGIRRPGGSKCCERHLKARGGAGVGGYQLGSARTRPDSIGNDCRKCYMKFHGAGIAFWVPKVILCDIFFEEYILRFGLRLLLGQ